MSGLLRRILSLDVLKSKLIVGRFLSSGSTFKLPEPTWSVEDLGLSKQHTPVSEEELRKLAKRAMLDFGQLDEKKREQLKQDLGNMMHIIQQVSSFEYSTDVALDASDMYDKPRGVKTAPLRDDSSDKQDKEQEDEAKQVWDSLLKVKATARMGAHSYFSIETKRE